MHFVSVLCVCFNFFWCVFCFPVFFWEERRRREMFLFWCFFCLLCLLCVFAVFLCFVAFFCGPAEPPKISLFLFQNNTNKNTLKKHQTHKNTQHTPKTNTHTKTQQNATKHRTHHTQKTRKTPNNALSSHFPFLPSGGVQGSRDQGFMEREGGGGS